MLREPRDGGRLVALDRLLELVLGDVRDADGSDPTGVRIDADQPPFVKKIFSSNLVGSSCAGFPQLHGNKMTAAAPCEAARTLRTGGGRSDRGRRYHLSKLHALDGAQRPAQSTDT